MSLGTWEPAADAAAHQIAINEQTLERLITFSRENQLEDLATLLPGADSQELAGLIRLDHSLWQSAVANRKSEDILHLIRFFAVAENLPGWEAGPDSAVIGLAKVLRKRGERLDKALLLWLRQVNDNRFLPYGPL
jgi:hypothetical protein